MTLEQLVATCPHVALRVRFVPGGETTQRLEGRVTEDADAFDAYQQNADGWRVRIEQR